MLKPFYRIQILIKNCRGLNLISSISGILLIWNVYHDCFIFNDLISCPSFYRIEIEVIYKSHWLIFLGSFLVAACLLLFLPCHYSHSLSIVTFPLCFRVVWRFLHYFTLFPTILPDLYFHWVMTFFSFAFSTSRQLCAVSDYVLLKEPTV